MSRYNLGYKYVNHDMWKKVLENCSKATAIKFPQHGKFNIAYGFDTMGCGYFIQFFDTKPADKDEFEQCINIDSLFDGLSGAELAFILQTLGGANQEHIELAYVDWSF